jgi:hypothetical protein
VRGDWPGKLLVFLFVIVAVHIHIYFKQLKQSLHKSLSMMAQSLQVLISWAKEQDKRKTENQRRLGAATVEQHVNKQADTQP